MIPQGKVFVVDEGIRRSVNFAYLNLALDVYPSFATGTWGMDLVLCRNVLIYFDAQTVRAVARRLYESLAPGGWLLTASSDPPLGEAAPFAPIVTDVGVFYRRNHDRGADTPPSPAIAPAVSEARGDVAPAVDPTLDPTDDADTAAQQVRLLANTDAAAAERACANAVRRHPLSAELHYLRAVLLLELGRAEEAAQPARRVIYLDRSLAVGHLILGAILWRCGDIGALGAAIAMRDLCAARPPDETVPLSDGEHAGRLAGAAAAQLAILDSSPEVTT